MENNGNFTNTLLPALDAKTQWYDNEELPRLLSSYRLLHTCVKNLFDFLVKKSLITPDPYKLDKKISEIKAPDSAQFVENEKSVIMGQRFSDYESMLDFLCNYYKFSTVHLNLQSIKKLLDLNASFLWSNFSINSNKANTRVLANLIADGRQTSDSLTSNMIGDSISKASQAMNDITSILKNYSDFQREFYKGQIRKNVFNHPDFNANKAFSSPADEQQMIRKTFAAAMGKVPFYSELIEEIIQEDQGKNKDDLQKKVLAKMDIVVKKVVKKEEKVDTREMLVSSLHTLGQMVSIFVAVIEKIKANHDVIDGEQNSLFEKIKKAFRQAFHLPDPPIYYSIIIVEKSTGAKKQEKLDYNQFISDLTTKAKRYGIFNQKKSQGYNKIMSMPDDKLFDFISTQITDCNKFLVTLGALDEFFKAAASPVNKPKIKGLKLDILSLKNSITRANQSRVEYSSYIQEAEQMKKLGISM